MRQAEAIHEPIREHALHPTPTRRLTNSNIASRGARKPSEQIARPTPLLQTAREGQHDGSGDFRDFMTPSRRSPRKHPNRCSAVSRRLAATKQHTRSQTADGAQTGKRSPLRANRTGNIKASEANGTRCTHCLDIHVASRAVDQPGDVAADLDFHRSTPATTTRERRIVCSPLGHPASIRAVATHLLGDPDADGGAPPLFMAPFETEAVPLTSPSNSAFDVHT